MKQTFFLLIILMIGACSSVKTVSSQAKGMLGTYKPDLVKAFGFPVRTIDAEKDEVLVYSEREYLNLGVYGQSAQYKYTMFWCDKNTGLVNYYMVKVQQDPPDVVNVYGLIVRF